MRRSRALEVCGYLCPLDPRLERVCLFSKIVEDYHLTEIGRIVFQIDQI